MSFGDSSVSRVRIYYNVDTGSASKKVELPFVAGIIADLSGDNDAKQAYSDRLFIQITRNNIADLMQYCKPSLNIIVNNLFISGTKLQCNLTFTGINDFSPYNVLNQIKYCQTILNDRANLLDLMSKVSVNAELSKALLSISSQLSASDAANLGNSSGFIAVTDSAEAQEYKAQLIQAYSNYTTPGAQNAYGALGIAITNIDAMLSEQLDLIMHHPKFQALEASWRSLNNFISNAPTSEQIKFMVLNASLDEIANDMNTATDFTKSTLYQRICEDEYGTVGGLPISCLLIDRSFDKTDDDIKLLHFLGQIASAAHSPLLGAASVNLLNLTSFAQINQIKDIGTMFAGSDFVGWNALRSADFSRYINLILPKFMIRAPYKPRSGTGLNYTETIASDADFCWGNSAYLMMQRIVVAFSKYNWAAAIRGPEGGGLVENLPIYLQDKAILGDFGMKCPLEVSINDTREKELSDFGLIALCHKKMSNQAVFFSGQSIQQAQKYDTSDATANAVLSTRLPYMLNASRFAHYMKVMLRNKIGTFQSKDQVQAYLQNWLGQYVLLSGQGQDLQAKYPLSEGLVTVTDDLSTPGEYSVSLSLKPNFQLEGVRVSISFVARLGQKTS